MLPLVTIVTVTFNAESFLEDTILSVLNQKFISFEYIIIDGGSTDNTLEIIKKYSNQIKYWESKPDKGIYDAMNSSLNHINGIWVCFMNAGDLFYDNNTLKNIFDIKNINLNLFTMIYVDHSYKSNSEIKIKNAGILNDLRKKMVICHQSILIKSDYLKENKFNINYKFSADYDLVIKIFKNNKEQIYYHNIPISIIARNGFSEKNSFGTYLEYKKISLKYFQNNYLRIYHFLILIERIFIQIIKKIISYSVK